jgi:hypothetical protein
MAKLVRAVSTKAVKAAKSVLVEHGPRAVLRAVQVWAEVRTAARA